MGEIPKDTETKRNLNVKIGVGLAIIFLAGSLVANYLATPDIYYGATNFPRGDGTQITLGGLNEQL